MIKTISVNENIKIFDFNISCDPSPICCTNSNLTFLGDTAQDINLGEFSGIIV